MLYLGFTNDVLDFSRIESGQLVIEHHDFDIEGLVEDAINPLALAAQDKRWSTYYWIQRTLQM